MSLLNKFKGLGGGRDGATGQARDANAMNEPGGSPGRSTSANHKADDPETRSRAGSPDSLMERTQVLDRLPSRLDPDARISIISEETPSGVTEFPDSRPFTPNIADAPANTGLPFIAGRPLAQQQAILGFLVLFGLMGLVTLAGLALNAASRGSAQVASTGQALMQSQRLLKSVAQAAVGNPQSFPELRESIDVMARTVRGLKTGTDDLPAAPSDLHAVIDPLLPLVERAEKNAAAVLAQQKPLTQAADAVREINRQSSALLGAAESVALLKQQQGAPIAEIAAIGQLVMLTQRIGKSANEFQTREGVNPEVVFSLGKDLNTFQELLTALMDGSVELRLPGTRDGPARDALVTLGRQFETTKIQAGFILGNVQGLIAARQAGGVIASDSEPLRTGLQSVQDGLAGQAAVSVLTLGLMALCALALVAGAAGLLKLFVGSQARRAAVAQRQLLEAEQQEQEAKRVNDATQAAILRLMNELQTVAEGDLTQQATVTEDITGAIADSVNYTVEELRNLVSQVQGTVSRVTDTTEQVELNSTELLAASTEQLHEIRETGEAVLQMASRINEVSARAQETAQVARQSLTAAETGLRAVQDTIGGMNQIRDQIRDTSKRIKRLGESSQEIGEITELISDITEQTNVLALNAAIQAASAGEAGRGFSVVAEEVQRLAERSGDATKQIAALVKTIQTDTQDAVGAMERSTQGVVEGARLSDAAGAALGDIDRVSRQLAELIEQISSEALGEAQSANVVATNIQHIFAVTEQTGDGTRSTAKMVRELSVMAEELKQSVARFKIV